MGTIRKIIKTFQAYCHYFSLALLEIYSYYTSPFPFLILMKKLALAHRKIRIIWAPKSRGRKPLDKETIDLILDENGGVIMSH